MPAAPAAAQPTAAPQAAPASTQTIEMTAWFNAAWNDVSNKAIGDPFVEWGKKNNVEFEYEALAAQQVPKITAALQAGNPPEMFIYDEQGFVNLLLLDTLGVTRDIINFRGSPQLAMGAVIAVAVWTGTPFYTMNFLAAMQAISEEAYEAAEIDGAGTFQRFWHITLPSLGGVILITTMLSAIWTSSNITVIYILTKGGPQHLTATVPYLAYELAIERKIMGAGAAVSLLMVPIYVVIVLILSKRMLRQES
jgi:ABC-type molybdate transport system permease subunit